MSSRYVVVGLTGAFGSGCSTAAEYLHGKLHFTALTLSKSLRNEWSKAHHGPAPRCWLQNLGDQYRKRSGNDVLVKMALRRQKGRRLVIDGIRNAGEVEYLRNRFGYDFTLIGIIPTFQARWDRIGSKHYSDDKIGMERFFRDDRRDQNEEIPYGQQVRDCIDQADILIDNSELITLGHFKRKVMRYVEPLLSKCTRPPERPEIFMSMAYSACQSSKCLKRHVGAVVIDSVGRVVGVGYNDNPVGTKPCKEEYGCCFKDSMKQMHLQELLEQTEALHCPICGFPITARRGLDRRCAHCSRARSGRSIDDIFFPDRATGWCTAIHAEAWALSAAGDRAQGGELFTTTHPCLQCAEKIIHAGIKALWYTEPYPDALSRDRLDIAGVEVKQFEGVRCFERMFAGNRPS